MKKVNSNNRKETKSATFPWDIFKSDVISFFVEKYFSMTFKIKFFSFLTKVNPNNVNETKIDIFHRTHSNLTSFLIGQKILKYFNDFYNWHLSISL